MDRSGMYARISSAGLTLFAAVLVGIFLGQYLDSLTGVQGIFTLIFIALGTGGGVYNLLRVVGKYTNGRRDN